MSEPSDPSESSISDESSTTSGNSTLVGLIVVVLLGALAVVAVLVVQSDSDDVATDEGTTTESTITTAPESTVTEPDEPPVTGPIGADSPLVGLTETQVREMYPLVRVVEVDGEPLMATMDLQMGRINLALEGDTVVGATTEGCDELGDDAPEWVRQSCDPEPSSDGPTTYGKLLADPAGGETLTLEVGTQGDQYHQGMVIRPAEGDVRVVLLDGTPTTADDLRPDDVVYVWTADECAESSPVQCDIQAVVVDRGTD